jgi:hypothetical protein
MIKSLPTRYLEKKEEKRKERNIILKERQFIVS